MSIPKILNFSDYNRYPADANPTTDADMQDFMGNQNSVLKNIVSTYLWQPQNNYVVNQEVHSPNMPAGYRAICITAGTSGTTEPSWDADTLAYTDGTVTWNIVSFSDGKVDKASPKNAEGKDLALAENVLALSGGTMTGSVTVPAIIVGNDSQIRQAGEEGHTFTSIFGRKDNHYGSSLFLSDKDGTDNAFILRAGDGTSTRKELFGNADGLFTWNGYPLCSVKYGGELTQSVTESQNSCMIGWTVPSGYKVIPFNPGTRSFVGAPYIESSWDTGCTLFWQLAGSGTVKIELLYIKTFE